jgi:hypothetical protein
MSLLNNITLQVGLLKLPEVSLTGDALSCQDLLGFSGQVPVEGLWPVYNEGAESLASDVYVLQLLLPSDQLVVILKANYHLIIIIVYMLVPLAEFQEVLVAGLLGAHGKVEHLVFLPSLLIEIYGESLEGLLDIVGVDV